jgi:hypothetical protein
MALRFGFAGIDALRSVLPVTGTLLGINFTQTGSDGSRLMYSIDASGLAHIWNVGQSATPSEGMRLNSTGLEVKGKLAVGYSDFSGIPTNGAAFAGSVGIGTSSPASKLHVLGVNSGSPNNTLTGSWVNVGSSLSIGLGMRQKSSDPGISGLGFPFQILTLGGVPFEIYTADAQPLVFGTNATERLRLDSSGNLGLGVTPSAWSTIKSMQIGTAASFSGGSGYNDAFIGSNAFFDGSNWKYINSNPAYYASVGGTAAARWYTSTDVTPTAGNAITFTQAMTLTAAGKLGIGGSTAPDFNLSIGSNFFGLNFSSNRLSLIQTNSASHSVALSSIGDSVIEASTVGSGNGFIEFRTLNTERARVSVDGYLRMASGSGGIQFNGDTAAANALDDYEQGTWTGTYEIATPGTSSITMVEIETGRYTKIGDKVTLTFSLRTSTITVGTGSGAVRLTGIPFAVLASSGSVGSILNQGDGGSAYNDFGYLVTAILATGSALYLYRIDGTHNTPILFADMGAGNANYLSGTITYTAA